MYAGSGATIVKFRLTGLWRRPQGRYTPRMRSISLAACLGVLGCSGGSGDSGSRATQYTKFTRQFGDALLAEEYARAYSMTSREYRSGTTLEAFTSLLRVPRARFGIPSALEIDRNTVDPARLASADYDANFAGVPAARRQARMSLTLVTKMEGTAVVAGYELWLNIVSEDGADRIVSIEPAW